MNAVDPSTIVFDRQERVRYFPAIRRLDCRRLFFKNRERTVMRHLIAAAVVVVGSSVASAALIEAEVNNTPAQANFVPAAVYTPSGGFAFDGSIVRSDVDYVSVSLAAGDYLGVTLFQLSGAPGSGIIQVLDPSLAVVGSAGGAFPATGFFAPSAGTYSIGISGAGDTGFVGQHGLQYNYKLVVGYNAVPEPATLGLLAGLSALVLRRR
jgi:hypothetical protein